MTDDTPGGFKLSTSQMPGASAARSEQTGFPENGACPRSTDVARQEPVPMTPGDVTGGTSPARGSLSPEDSQPVPKVPPSSFPSDPGKTVWMQILERTSGGPTKAGIRTMCRPLHQQHVQLPRHRATPTTRRGFTLLELLVVLAVLALLGSLLLPALARARDTARTSTCLSRLRQWGLGTHVYGADCGGWLPADGAPNGLSTRNAWYTDLPPSMGIAPYHEEGAWRTNARAPLGHPLWFCPSNPRRSNGHLLFHFCLNRHLNGSGRDSRPRRLESFAEPSRTVWIFDNGGRAAVAGPNNLHRTVHRGAGNVLCLDGGVRRVPRARVDGTSADGTSTDTPLLWKP